MVVIIFPPFFCCMFVTIKDNMEQLVLLWEKSYSFLEKINSSIAVSRFSTDFCPIDSHSHFAFLFFLRHGLQSNSKSPSGNSKYRRSAP